MTHVFACHDCPSVITFDGQSFAVVEHAPDCPRLQAAVLRRCGPHRPTEPPRVMPDGAQGASGPRKARVGAKAVR